MVAVACNKIAKEKWVKLKVRLEKFSADLMFCSHESRDVPYIPFPLTGYAIVFIIRFRFVFRFRVLPKCRTTSDILTGYFAVSIPTLEEYGNSCG